MNPIQLPPMPAQNTLQTLIVSNKTQAEVKELELALLSGHFLPFSAAAAELPAEETMITLTGTGGSMKNSGKTGNLLQHLR